MGQVAMATGHGGQLGLPTDMPGQLTGGRALRSCHGAKKGHLSGILQARNAAQQCEKEVRHCGGIKRSA